MYISSIDSEKNILVNLYTFVNHFLVLYIYDSLFTALYIYINKEILNEISFGIRSYLML